ncbi:hypothetical protein [uncultured Vagococcus sp.]|uniref:hypothetical protein n=1 Tax=uncultured Vagococcus sp. TaxID=189676 RepID=UPI0028D154AB|nr:hypothetical protein [uncultured Vagococcus sp.]
MCEENENRVPFIITSENVNQVIFQKISISSKNDIDIFMKSFKDLLTAKKDRDNCVVTFIDIEDSELFDSGSIDIIDLVLECSERYFKKKELIDEESFEIEIYIDKNNLVTKECTVYSFYSTDSLLQFFTKNDSDTDITLFESLRKCESYFQNVKIVYFELIFDELELITNKFIISSKPISEYNWNTSNQERNELLRQSKLDKIFEKCNFLFTTLFLPEDFRLHFEVENTKYKIFFEKMTLLLSISCISNVVTLEGDELDLKIEGNRLVIENVDFKYISDLDNKAKVFYEIYDWVYQNGDSIDERIGITRNVITLFFDGKSIFSRYTSLLPSIKSNFELYLKENVDRYVEVLNQVVSLLKDLNKETSEKVENLTSKFKNNFFAFFAFFASTVLFNTISSGKIENIFTKDITKITIAFLAMSFIYLLISVVEMNSDIERVEKNYQQNKSYYLSVLNQEDITRIFNNDENYRDDMDFMKRARLTTIIMWGLTILIISILLLFVGTL